MKFLIFVMVVCPTLSCKDHFAIQCLLDSRGLSAIKSMKYEDRLLEFVWASGDLTAQLDKPPAFRLRWHLCVVCDQDLVKSNALFFVCGQTWLVNHHYYCILLCSNFILLECSCSCVDAVPSTIKGGCKWMNGFGGRVRCLIYVDFQETLSYP